MEQTETFDVSQIDAELDAARKAGRAMVKDALAFLDGDRYLHPDLLPYLGFIERAQAFHLGALAMIEQGNPLAAVTLIRAYAENVAAVYWVTRKPTEIEKMRPGASEGLPMGRVIAEAERNLTGFKELYKVWCLHAHPSGAGAFHTLNVTDGGHFTWQSHPNFRSAEDASQILEWLDWICALTTEVIRQTVEDQRPQRESTPPLRSKS